MLVWAVTGYTDRGMVSLDILKHVGQLLDIQMLV